MGKASGSVLTIRQGRIDLSCYQVVGEVFAHILTDPRLFIGTSESPPAAKIEVLSAPHADAFTALREDKVDILLGWFDGSHGTYIDPVRHEVLILGDARQDGVAQTPAVYSPYCIWAVPAYVPEAIVPNMPSLADPSVAARFVADETGKRRILQGINPGAGISRFSKEMVHSYSLASQGWHFRSGTQPECFGRVEQCIHRKEWFVVPLWHPQYLHAIYNLRTLAEPKGLLRPIDEARLVLSRRFLAKFSDDERTALLKVLNRVILANEAVTLMDKYVHVDKLSYYDAAQRWISENQSRVDSWFESGHADILQRASEVESYALPEEDVHTIEASRSAMAVPDKAPTPAGVYNVFSVSSKGLIHTSLQLPWALGHDLPVGSPPKMAFVGHVSKSRHTAITSLVISEEQAYQAARTCALNLLAVLRDASEGDLARIQLLRLDGYVAISGTPEETAIVPKILDAASSLISHAFGREQGAHARTAVMLIQIHSTYPSC